ncbi:nuclear speckle splicing regulatory protein 1 [Diabrotica virgifera virgifera]|uniref:Nuclear speckle splicing regulatory protein 1-like n=1 Tax=Diabrotica virgifera virgifera TaxID=50390 RepID=A0A6P7FZC6_DIAVI|nr:nuclear speckle splicing regulatory protein 1 [Diabrotica virgifera virgifera]
MAKQYGLSYPKKNQGHQIGQLSSNKPSIFGEDSEEELETKRPTGLTKGLKKQDEISQKKALEDDPTVYQYDEVYDDIEKKRNDSKLAKKDIDKKPKYISRLLVAAEKRKRENDRRIERQVQKEREEEGDTFKDKESFITPSYKKKLEEMRELEEQEKREEYLESIGDVKKQGNLDGFYRHLYDQKVNFEEKEEPTTVIKKETSDDDTNKASTSEIKDTANENENSDDMLKHKSKKRKYRVRKDSDESSETEEPEIKKEHLPSNIDADSDFSINSSDSEEEKESKVKSEKVNEVSQTVSQTEPDKNSDNKTETKEEKKLEEIKTVDNKDENEVKVPPKPKIDIWKKRTVGEKFDEAVKRYFERKALRETG